MLSTLQSSISLRMKFVSNFHMRVHEPEGREIKHGPVSRPKCQFIMSRAEGSTVQIAIEDWIYTVLHLEEKHKFKWKATTLEVFYNLQLEIEIQVCRKNSFTADKRI